MQADALNGRSQQFDALTCPSRATTLRDLLYEVHRQRANIQIGPDDDDDLAGIA